MHTIRIPAALLPTSTGMRNLPLTLAAAIVSAALFAPALPAGAHEVYVLSSSDIAVDTAVAPFDMLAVAAADLHQFLFWGFIAVFVVVCVFCISILRPLERRLSRLFARLKPYAPAVSRITIGLGLIAASYFGAAFGPELPLAANFGGYAPLVSLTLAVVGTLMLIGFWARAAALVALALFGLLAYGHGWYMLTYANYFGEMLVLLLIGSHRVSVHALTGWTERFHWSYHILMDKIQHVAFPILRVSFGVSLLYASIYAKILHNNLALQVASLPLAGHAHGLAYYFGMDPHFLVLGAAIIEIAMAVFFILGIEIRFASIFLLFWLSLSLWYFGEVVWPHIILIGIPIAFIFHGYDQWSLEGRLFNKGKLQPVL